MNGDEGGSKHWALYIFRRGGCGMTGVPEVCGGLKRSVGAEKQKGTAESGASAELWNKRVSIKPTPARTPEGKMCEKSVQ